MFQELPVRHMIRNEIDFIFETAESQNSDMKLLWL